MDASYGCGDLIFSSHTIFTLTVCLLITQYLPVTPIVIGAWFIQAVLVFLILCSRKHYTVDIVVALYTVPMVWALLQWKLKDPKVEMYYDSWLYFFFLCKIYTVVKRSRRSMNTLIIIILSLLHTKSRKNVVVVRLLCAPPTEKPMLARPKGCAAKSS